MRNKYFVFLIMLLLFIPISISAMVMRVVEKPFIKDVYQNEEMINLHIAYPTNLENVLDYYKTIGIVNPLKLEIEVNINRSGWEKKDLINSESFDEIKSFKWDYDFNFNDRTVEFRLKVNDTEGAYLSSEWSDIYSVNLDKLISIEQPLGEVQENHQKQINASKLTEKNACLFGISTCCNSFLNISLCIWIIIAIILVIAIIIVLLLKKKDKKLIQN